MCVHARTCVFKRGEQYCRYWLIDLSTPTFKEKRDFCLLCKASLTDRELTVVVGGNETFLGFMFDHIL